MPAIYPNRGISSFLCIVISLVALSNILTAQNIQSQSTKQVVYFKTGASNLNQASLSTLDSLAKVLLKKPVYKLKIEGHTDDVGDTAYNKTLSQKRAQEVKQYLEGKGIKTTRIQTNHFGESTPSNSNLSDEGRAANRRVEIQFRYPVFSSVKEIKAVIPTKQEYSYHPQEVKQIEATHGTIFNVPKEAFVFADGTKPTAPIQIEVIESLTKANHILNDLSTVSNGQMLETGGMIYIRASSEGKELKLDNNKAIEINIPSNEVKEEMQLFYADNNSKDDNVNWVLDKKQTVNKKAPFSFKLNEEEKTAFLQSLAAISIPTKQLPEEPDMGLLYQLTKPPKKPRKPYQPKKPIYPKLVDVSSKKNKKGTKKKFTKNDIKNHQYRLDRYVRRYAKYQKDSSAYEDQLISYNQRYKQYILDYDAWEKSKKIITNEFISFYKESEEYLDIIQAQKSRIKLQEMIQKDQVNTQQLFNQLQNQINISKDREFLTEVQYKVYLLSKKHPDLFLRDIKNVCGLRHNCDPLYFSTDTYMRQIKQVSSDIQNIYQERKIQSGNFTAQDVNSYFTSINQLGWINIDRFLKMEERKELLVNTKNESKNYLVFKDINSILPIIKKNENDSLSAVTCPNAYEATIVSISIDEEGQILFASKSINTMDEQIHNLNYEVCSLQDIEEALNIMN